MGHVEAAQSPHSIFRWPHLKPASINPAGERDNQKHGNIQSTQENPGHIISGKTTGVNAVIGRTIYEAAQLLQNEKAIHDFYSVADEINKEEQLPYAGENIELSEERLLQGLIIHGFGDSRMRRNMVAGIPGAKEQWVDDGAIIRLLEEKFHQAGFAKVKAFPHAEEGMPSRKILNVMYSKRKEMIEEGMDELIIRLMSGNDFRDIATGGSKLESYIKTFKLAKVVLFPRITNIRRFRHKHFDPVTKKMSEYKLEASRLEQDIYLERKKDGKETHVAILTYPQFSNEADMEIWTNERNGQDKHIATLKKSEELNRAGAITTGGAVIADHDSLEEFREELAQYPESDRVPVSVIPLSKVGINPDGSIDTSVFDTTYHFNRLGHEATLEILLHRIIIVNKLGQKETLAARLQRMQQEQQQSAEDALR